jgi:hypothetical protein
MSSSSAIWEAVGRETREQQLVPALHGLRQREAEVGSCRAHSELSIQPHNPSKSEYADDVLPRDALVVEGQFLGSCVRACGVEWTAR